MIYIQVKLISYPKETDLIAKMAASICYSGGHDYEEIRKDAERKPAEYLSKIVKNGHLSILEHNIYVFYVSGLSRVCYDKKTEIYTKTGWKYLKDVTMKDEFLTRKENGRVEFQKAINLINFKYEGEMHKYKSQNIDLLVTPNHNLFTRRYDLRKNDNTNFSLIPSNQLPQKRMVFDKRITHNPDIPDTITIKGYSYIRKDNRGRDRSVIVPDLVIERTVFFRFLAWYLSEGNTQYNSKENSYQIRIYQSTKKQAHRNEIEETIIRLGYNSNRLKNFIQFKSMILGKFLKKLGRSYEKEIPFDLFKEFNRSYARIFLSTYAKGDGTVESNGHVRLYTTSKRLANQLQMLSFIAGYTANIWVDDRSGSMRQIGNKYFKNQRKCYVVSLSKGKRNKNPVMKKDLHFSTIKYHDNVYCVEVPKHHVIFIRRNSKALWCGNCSHQLVRKRIASYSQQSQRYVDAKNFRAVIPETIENSQFTEQYSKKLEECSNLYQEMVDSGIPKEDARFILPGATTTQLIVSMNAHSLVDFFVQRLCVKSQWEIRQLAEIMLDEAQKVSPLIFKDLGAYCDFYGYCPENDKSCGRIKTLKEILHNDN